MNTEKTHTCDLLISGDMNRRLVDKILGEIQQEHYQPKKRLRLVIDSPGGSVTHSIFLARVLMNSFHDIHTYNLGTVDSAAICLYLCGSTRFACPSSRFFLHPPGVEVTGIQTESQLKDILRGLQIDTRDMVDFYTERTGLSAKTWRTIFRHTCHITAEEARKFNIVTKLVPLISDFTPRVISEF